MAIQPVAPGFAVSASAVGLRQINWRDVARGDERAIAILWDRYFPRLVRYFAGWYQRRPRPAVDEEDLALDVFERTYWRLKLGKLGAAISRRSFEQILFVAARRRLLSQRRFDRRQKRDAGRSRSLDQCGDSLLQGTADHVIVFDLQSDLKQLLDGLTNDFHRTLIEQRLDGADATEIARSSNCSSCTVRRNLQSIRARWSKDLGLHG